MLNGPDIARRLGDPGDSNDPLLIAPKPDLEKLRNRDAASVDLRLGRWFLTSRQTNISVFDVFKNDASGSRKDNHFEGHERQFARRHFVPFGKSFVIHPSAFVLGGTLEWIRLPDDIGGYIIGKSSWGRRGLIIETAAGVHPGFTGCLTLEITNVGEVPIAIYPGLQICQVFLHHAGPPELGESEGASDPEATTAQLATSSPHVGHRRPTLSSIEIDPTARKLIRPNGEDIA